MDPLTALQPLGGFGYTYGGFGFGTFGAAAARTTCCPGMPQMPMPQMPTACCPTKGANPNKAIQKSLKRMEKQTAKLLKLLMRLMEGRPVKKGKKD